MKSKGRIAADDNRDDNVQWILLMKGSMQSQQDRKYKQKYGCGGWLNLEYVKLQYFALQKIQKMQFGKRNNGSHV